MAGEMRPFGELFAEPPRNGLTRPKAVRGAGVKMVNMGELFAHPRLSNAPMDRVPLSESEAGRFLLKEGDLLFARQSLVLEGAGKCSIFLNDVEPVTFESHVTRVRLDPRKADPRFYYYYLQSHHGCAAIRSIVEQGAGASGIRGSDLAKLDVQWHPVDEQRAIAHILGTLDDKIELNRRMNETLEAMARALFKSWFVDFDPVRAKAEGGDPGLSEPLADLFSDSFEDSELGEIPKGWKAGKVGDLCDAIYSGGTPSTQNPEYWNGDIPWLSSGETRERFIINTEKRITAAGVSSSSTRLAPAMSTVIASAGQGNTRGQTSLLTINSYVNQSVVVLTAKPKTRSPYHLFFDLERRYEEFRRVSDAHSSRGSLTTKLLAGLDAVLPPYEVILGFDAAVADAMKRTVGNLHESHTLAALRDTLLPKLISGELRVRVDKPTRAIGCV